MPDTLRLDLDLLLPDAPDADDACARRLTDALAAQPGVERAHVVTEAGEARLCLHYDPTRLPMPRLRALAEQTGADLSARYGHLNVPLGPTHTPRAARALGDRLRRTPGVLEADAGPGRVRVEFDRHVTSAEAVARQIDGGDGVRETPVPPVPVAETGHAGHAHGDDGHGHDHAAHDHAAHGGGAHDHAHGGIFGERTPLVLAGMAGVLMVAAWGVERFAPGVAGAVPAVLYTLSYVCGGWFAVQEAAASLRSGRFDIDVLMIVSAVGAAILGHWFEGAFLLFLFSLGHALEGMAMGRARRAIEALSALAPDTATVRRPDGREETVGVETLALGDLVVVRPNERLPADGVVVAGTSSVDQAPVTGESVPVDKQPVADRAAALDRPDAVDAESRVFAATINGRGALDIVVTRRASESTLARVADLVASAQTHPSPTQRFTDRVERVYVPAVLVFVGLLFFAPLVTGETVADAAYRALAVLIAASPCALAISTPSAVLAGIARAGRGGVLVKGGAPLEDLGRLDTIAFDKTGTLTEGRPRLTDVVPADGVSAAELLAPTRAVERLSDHPLARAIVDGAATWEGVAIPDETATDLTSITGRGVRAVVGGDVVHVGKPVLFDELDGGIAGGGLPEAVRAVVDRLEADGRTTMAVRRGDRVLGAIGVMDTPRPAANAVVARLRELGIRRMLMLSGDNARVAAAVASATGIDEARGDLMPEDKLDTIRDLAADGAGVAMVGDGVNDAPALAAATVGIAMGAAGSDVALETADVALMGDDLRALPFAVGLSRRVRRIVRQNLWISLGMVAVLIPATVFGLDMGPAVVMHEGSTLVVVANALRLLGVRDTSDR